MVTCPKGHTSAATDYCDECGAPISAGTVPSSTVDPAAPPVVAGPASGPGSGSASGSGAGAVSGAEFGSGAGSGEPCPECGTARGGRFCEVCGHDFLAVTPPAGPAPSTADAAPPSTRDAAPSVGEAVPATGAAVPATGQAAPSTGDAASPSTGESAVPAAKTGAAAAPGAQPAARWRLVVAADRAYFDRMQAVAEPDAQAVAFPAYCPQRRFDLAGEQVLVGRRSRSRGIEPDIDLTGPPEDAGVSHTHALFVTGGDGTWSVVDLGSANGTYLNDGTDPLRPNEPVRLTPGDRVHVGAWTTLTVVTA